MQNRFNLLCRNTSILSTGLVCLSHVCCDLKTWSRRRQFWDSKLELSPTRLRFPMWYTHNTARRWQARNPTYTLTVVSWGTKHSTTKDHTAAKTVGLYLPDWREYSPTEGTAYTRSEARSRSHYSLWSASECGGPLQSLCDIDVRTSSWCCWVFVFSSGTQACFP